MESKRNREWHIDWGVQIFIFIFIYSYLNSNNKPIKKGQVGKNKPINSYLFKYDNV